MKPVHFKQVTIEIAKDQPEYVTLPAHIANDPQRTTTTCFELDEKELKKINETKRFWHQQWTGKDAMQPILMMVDNPFGENEFKSPPTALEMIAEQHEILEKDNGYTLDNNKKLTDGQLAEAASVYAMFATSIQMPIEDVISNHSEVRKVAEALFGTDAIMLVHKNHRWPKELEYMPFPKDRLKELSKAGAFIIAEMERLMMEDVENG